MYQTLIVSGDFDWTQKLSGPLSREYTVNGPVYEPQALKAFLPQTYDLVLWDTETFETGLLVPYRSALPENCKLIMFTAGRTGLIGPEEWNGVLDKGLPPEVILAAVTCIVNGLSVWGAPGTGAVKNPPPLTDRELAVLKQTALGYANKEIAFSLGISERTVKFHLTSVFEKLNVKSRTEAVTRAIRLGLIPL